MNVFELMASINLDTSKYNSELDKAENKGSSVASKIGSGMSNLASGVGKAMATIGAVTVAGVGAGATALTAFGKSAIDAYADFEQLEGGIQTLFKDDWRTVRDNAELAFKTAGLSANEYMETVTGFSASLIASLGGDTKKAGEVSDQIIRDMSDNANKMGTSMESIMNSYAGFSKQNYTMLDNLKLGYGGTQEEMKRLLADAEKLSGIKYDISSFADVAEAIHVIQTELDITGTTAKEASSTISGSLGMLKSSWENLTRVMANDELDGEGYFRDFTDSLDAVLRNLIPRIGSFMNMVAVELPLMAGELVDALSGTIQELAPSLLDSAGNLLDMIVTGIIEGIPKLVQPAVDIVTNLANYIIEQLPMILNTAIQIITELVNGISTALPQLVPVAVEAIATLVDTLLGNANNIIDSGISLIMSLADGLIKALPKLIDKVPTIITKLVMAITTNLPKIVEAGVNLVVQLAVGLVKAIPSLVKAVPQLIGALVLGLGNMVYQFVNVGGNLIAGLVQGFINGIGSAITAVVNGAKSIVGAVKKVFGIASPSKVFRGIGDFCVEGLEEGLEPLSDGSIVNDAISNINNGFSGISSDFAVDGKLSTDNRVLGLLAEYLPQLGNQKIVLDSGVLVGQTVKKYDEALGKMSMNGRGVITV